MWKFSVGGSHLGTRGCMETQERDQEGEPEKRHVSDPREESGSWVDE